MNSTTRPSRRLSRAVLLRGTETSTPTTINGSLLSRAVLLRGTETAIQRQCAGHGCRGPFFYGGLKLEESACHLYRCRVPHPSRFLRRVGFGECAPQSKHGLLVDNLSPTLGYAKDGAPVLFCLGMKEVSLATSHSEESALADERRIQMEMALSMQHGFSGFPFDSPTAHSGQAPLPLVVQNDILFV